MLPAQKKDTEALLRKAAIAVTPQRVTADSPAVNALVGQVAAYVKPAPRQEQPARGQSQGGRSQGANAQRKRENRYARGGDAVPSTGGARRDRSGRPAASGAPKQGSTAGHGSRSQGAGSGRSGGLQVGGLVRGSSSSAGGGARRSAPRRAQG
jgi:hypothetical protein